MYVSTQKFPQIFLYMSTTCCESFKSFEEVGKKFFLLATFMTPKFCHLYMNNFKIPRQKYSTNMATWSDIWSSEWKRSIPFVNLGVTGAS